MTPTECPKKARAQVVQKFIFTSWQGPVTFEELLQHKAQRSGYTGFPCRFGGHAAGRQRAMPHMKTYTCYTRYTICYRCWEP